MHWHLANTEPTTLISALAKKSQINQPKPLERAILQTEWSIFPTWVSPAQLYNPSSDFTERQHPWVRAVIMQVITGIYQFLRWYVQIDTTSASHQIPKMHKKTTRRATPQTQTIVVNWDDILWLRHLTVRNWTESIPFWVKQKSSIMTFGDLFLTVELNQQFRD